MPVYLYWGEEEFNINKAVKKLREQTVDLAWASISHKTLDEPEMQVLIEALETIPMAFGNLLFEISSTKLFQRVANKVSSDDPGMERLLSIIENTSHNLHILFISKVERGSGKKVDSATKLVKTIKKVGTVEEFASFKPWDTDKICYWIQKNAEEKECKVSRDAALALIEAFGGDLQKTDFEIDKLKLAVHPNKTIDKATVLQLCSSDEDIFALTDKIIQKDKAGAIIELDKLFEKNHPVKIIATLQSMSRKWLKMKSEAQRKTIFELSKELGMHEFRLQKDLEKMRNFSLEEIISFRKNLLDAEFKIKSGQMEAKTSLEIAISL